MLKRADNIGLTIKGRLKRKERVELTDEQKKELKEAFDLFDSEKRGYIDYHELKVAMRGLGFNVKKQEVLDIVDDADPTGSGKVQYNDFLEIMRKKYATRDPDEEIRKAFQLFDDDGSGKISIKNMRRVVRELGESVNDEELQAMIDEFDLDQDGQIDEKEFFNIMKQSTMY